MPHCAAFRCNFDTKKSKGSSISLHGFPKEQVRRRQWIHAVGRTTLPIDPRLCSQHFSPDCFDESARIAKELLGSCRWKRKLREDAVPTIFSHKPAKRSRILSEKRAKQRERQQSIVDALSKNAGPSSVSVPPVELAQQCVEVHVEVDNISDDLAQAENENEAIEVLSKSTTQFCEIATQTEPVSKDSKDAVVQFPQDISDIIWHEHLYSMSAKKKKSQDEFENSDLHGSEDERDLTENGDENDSQFELFVSACDNEMESHSKNSCEEAMEVIVSQSTQSQQSMETTDSSQCEYDPGTLESESSTQNTNESQGSCPSITEQRVFLVYEEQLRELYKFCPKCGSLVIQEDISEVKNEGSQLSVRLTCINGCMYKWQSQPPIQYTKGAGNILLTAAIFFSGIHFSKFERFSFVMNLNTISESTYYSLREKYIFPIIKKTWEQEQASVFAQLKSRDDKIALAGDGRCDSPGHCAKYCTYTLLDVASQKVVDFKVISVSQVSSSNVMEIKGFKETLQNVEAHGIKAAIVSTDRHPQIRKEMRVNHQEKDHQFDPWHLCKSVSKKMWTTAKRKDCEELGSWIHSIINHLWWSVSNCEGSAHLLKEKWVSAVHHVTNRHEWPGNRHFHKCEHEAIDPEQQRKKKWLKPGSPGHKALVAIVKDKKLLKDMEHLTKCVHTTSLEVYHSMYLKYLPKLTHFSHKVMMHGTMLAAMDHNNNAKRPQAVMQDGESKGEPRFKISWNKVTKRFGAEPVLERKSYGYMRKMVEEAFDLAEHGNETTVTKDDRTHIMAPEQRPERKEIIEKRKQLSRFK